MKRKHVITSIIMSLAICASVFTVPVMAQSTVSNHAADGDFGAKARQLVTEYGPEVPDGTVDSIADLAKEVVEKSTAKENSKLGNNAVTIIENLFENIENNKKFAEKFKTSIENR